MSDFLEMSLNEELKKANSELYVDNQNLKEKIAELESKLDAAKDIMIMLNNRLEDKIAELEKVEEEVREFLEEHIDVFDNTSGYGRCYEQAKYLLEKLGEDEE